MPRFLVMFSLLSKIFRTSSLGLKNFALDNIQYLIFILSIQNQNQNTILASNVVSGLKFIVQYKKNKVKTKNPPYYFVCQCIQHKSTNWGHFFTSPTRDGTTIFRWSSDPREGLAVCRAKAISSFFSYFKTLSIGLAPGVEPATSCSAFKSFSCRSFLRQ